MRFHLLPGTDLRVSTFCYGGGAWGTLVRGGDMDRLINAFRDCGGNFFDTAHVYSSWLEGGTGASELALADYFRRNGGMDEVVVATKGGHPGMPGYRTVDRYLSPERIGADIDDSLGRLGLETIDLYWLHRDDPRLPVGEIVETLNAEVRRGRIRYLGASNWTAARIRAANEYAQRHGLRGFAASQPEWSLGRPNPAVRDPSTHFFSPEDHAWHAREGLPVVPYTPTAGGYFATGGASARDGFENEVSRNRLDRAERLAAELGCTANQVALAYLLGQKFPVIPIIGTKSLAHLEDAMGALEVKLSEDRLSWLLDG